MLARRLPALGLVIVSLLVLLSLARPGGAQPRVPLGEPFGTSARMLDERAGGAGAEVGVALGFRGRATSSELLGGLWVAVPFDRMPPPGRRASSAARSIEPVPTRAPGKAKGAEPRPKESRPAAPRPPAPEKPGAEAPWRGAAPVTSDGVKHVSSSGPGPERAPVIPRIPDERTLRRLIRIDPEELQHAVDAAASAAGLDARAESLADLARRARRSAALPELRLRAARSATESASTVPTSYDPLRQTFSDGVTLWLEARATWHLDRALFASEELRLLRHDEERRRDRERLEARVEELLFGWQTAVAERLDPSASFRECRAAFVRELHLAEELDRVTRGWFARHRSARPPIPESDCLTVAERVER
ncbi:MAG: hypothetical protein FJ096_11165 [Deltaproteobacteria bacterium]|nr:hypothetical protein [Deltaproteobacteria bacterium]